MDGMDGIIGWVEMKSSEGREWSEKIYKQCGILFHFFGSSHMYEVANKKIVFASQQSISIRFSWLLQQTVPDNDCLLSLWKYYMDVLDVEAYQTNQLLIVITNMKKNTDLRCRHRIIYTIRNICDKMKMDIGHFVDFLFCSVGQIIIAWLDWVYHKLQSYGVWVRSFHFWVDFWVKFYISLDRVHACHIPHKCISDWPPSPLQNALWHHFIKLLSNTREEIPFQCRKFTNMFQEPKWQGEEWPIGEESPCHFNTPVVAPDRICRKYLYEQFF